MPELPAPVMAWWLQMYRDTQSLPINALQVKKRRHVLPDAGELHREVLAAALQISS